MSADKVHTLDEIRAACHDPDHPANQPKTATLELPPLTDRPWWVVVVNPRRQPPQPKFVFSYMTSDEAKAECKRRQEIAGKQAEAETKVKGKDWPAFRFFVIERPEGGNL